MISARIVLTLLITVFTVLLLARGAGLYLTYALGESNANGFVPLFNFNEEQSVPTWFSSALLMICASLLGVIAAAQRYAHRPHLWWSTLALVFVYLSLDESVGFHERLNRPVRDLLHTSGALYYAWVIPYAIFAAFLGVFSIRPLRALSIATRRRLVLAGALFVCGAIGMEVIGSMLATGNQMRMTLLSDAVITLEEILEMSGAIVMVYALMKHIAGTHPGFGVTITD